MRRGRPRHSGNGIGLLLIAGVALLLFSQAATAQSGRRQSKSAPPPPPPVTASEPATTTPAANPPSVKPAASATVIVGGNKFNSDSYVLSSYVGDAIQACMDRLKESHALEVIGGGSNMTRKDAVDRAKKEQEAYVLLLEIKGDNDANANLAVIEYTLIKPQTAKIATSGRVYLGNKTVGAGGVGVGVPSVSRHLPLQYQVREGAKQVADRVKDKLEARPSDQ